MGESKAGDFMMVERPNGQHQIDTPEDEDLNSSSEGDLTSDDDMQTDGAASISNEEVFIAVMGVTGAGKSTFISQLTEDDVKVGHSLQSCTSELGVYTYFYKGKTIRLVDTPGFDDTKRSDSEILRDIAFFLTTLYSRKAKLAGIVYLHRITDVRMGGSAFRNLQMLEKLCGDGAFHGVVVATTMWNLLDLPGSENTFALGEAREKELKEKFWNRLQEKGSFITRHMGDAKSGRSIAEYLIDKDTNVILDIQREMVDEKLDLHKTAAGMFLQSDQLKMREKFERELAYAQESLDEALKSKDQELIAQYTKEREEYQSKIASADADQSGLHVNYTSLVEEKGQEYAALAKEMEANKKAQAEEMKFIEHNLTELQDSLERQERDHRDQLNRLMRNQSAKSAAEAQRIEQLTEAFKRQQAEMLGQIAAMEEARRKKTNFVQKLFTLEFWGSLIPSEEERYRDQRMQQRSGRQQYNYQRQNSGRQRNRDYYY